MELKPTRYPVIDKNYKAGLFDPLQNYPSDHAINKNRKDWSLEEIENLMYEELGFRGARPAKAWVWAVAFEPSDHMKMLDNAPSTTHEWTFAKAIIFGDECFDSTAFPTGAPITYGDYFYYHSTRTTPIKLDNGKKLLICHDTNVLGWIEHPTKITMNFYKGE